MKFVILMKILMKQKGEGCDYMIGCGYKYVFFEAKDMDDALFQVRTKDRDDYDGPREMIWGHTASEIAQAMILPVNETVDALCTKSKREQEEEAEQKRLEDEEERVAKQTAALEREAKERSEFERLKKKFGNAK